MKDSCTRMIAQLLIPLLAVFNISPWVMAAEKAPLSDTKILYQPINSCPAGTAVPISVTVEDSAGVEVVRAYFKSTVGSIYYYIPLIKSKNTLYSGILPAPAVDAGSLEYLLLVKNNNNVVVKSQHYQCVVAEKPSKPQAETKRDKIKVYSESPYASKYIIGFEGGYDFQVADPAEKYGVVAGLYNPESVSWISTDAVSGGTVDDDSSDSSWNPWLLGGAAVAGIAVVALALGGSGGGGGSTSPDVEDPNVEDPEVVTPPPPPPPVVVTTGSGSWKLTTYKYSTCTSGAGQTQTVTCTASGTFETVTPASLVVAVPDNITPDTCINGTTPGLAEIFVSGKNCDAVEACNSFSASNVVSKVCKETSITIVRDNSNHSQVWEKQ